MPARAIQIDDLLHRMANDPSCLVIARSSRAAGAIRCRYNAFQSAAGLGIWEPANILSWSQFLSMLWNALLIDGQEDRLLLNSAQEHLLWREIIAGDSATSALTPVDSLASLAASAWSLASAYRAESQIRPTASTEDARTFARWADEFARRCGRDRLIAAANLDAAIEAHVLAGRQSIPASSVMLCGLSDLTPSARSLIAALEERNVRLEHCFLTAKESRVATLLLPDEQAELRYAVRFLRDHLEKHPGHTVALLVSELGQERVHVEPVLRELLAPELQDISEDFSTKPWEMSASPPLSHHPMIAALLDLSRWLRGSLSIDRISALLLSPYLSFGVPLPARARFDAHTLRRQLLLRPELDLRSVLQLARSKASEMAPWFSSLYDFLLQLDTAKLRRTYAEWGQTVRELAKHAGWPGDRTLTAAEHETALAFDAVLDLLATLDFAGKTITFAEALEALERQLKITPSPVIPSAAHLHVLTPSEAAGLVFDSVVYLRATDANLPAQVRPNPLLDWTLQRKLSMPGADLRVAHAQAQSELEQLLAATGEMLFLSAAHSESGALRPSALPATLGALPAVSQLPAESRPSPLALDAIEDISPLPALPSANIPGAGARLLQLQAACGFLAFAELRLGGRELESPDQGFDARESGNILHRTLQRFWEGVQDQATLARLAQQEREQAVTEAIDNAFSREIHPAGPWDAAYMNVQKRRLHALLMDWIDFELQRGPFSVVGLESKQTVQVGPLELTVRLDRIDRTSDGGFVYVDYKTGATARPSNWEGDRPDEPQLPLYTLLAEPEEIRGITFAKLRPGKEMQWTGWATDPSILPKKGFRRVEMQDEIEGWRTTLTRLAEDFAAGDTRVHPKSYAVNCKRCAQRLLCRLDLDSLLSQPEVEADAESGE